MEDSVHKKYKIDIPVKELKPGMSFAGILFDDAENKLAEGNIKLTEEQINDFKQKNIQIVHYYTMQLDTSMPSYASYKEILDAGESAVSKPVQTKALKTVEEVTEKAAQGQKLYAEEITPIVRDIYKDLQKNKIALIGLMKLKTKADFVYTHSVNVGTLCVYTADYMKMPEDVIIELGLAGLIHDIGYVKIPPQILNKPDKLTADEYRIIQQHPQIGHDILNADINSPVVSLKAILYHHERYDASGYPKGYSGNQIDIYTQILAVSDTYEAMTSDRPYRDAYSPKDALLTIYENSGKLFHPKVAIAFVRGISGRIHLESLFDPGTYVVLNTGEIARVEDENKDNLTKPIVAVVRDVNKKFRKNPTQINLGYDNTRSVVQTIHDEKIISAIEQAIS